MLLFCEVCSFTFHLGRDLVTDVVVGIQQLHHLLRWEGCGQLGSCGGCCVWPGGGDGWCMLGGGGVVVLIFTMMGVVRALDLLGSGVVDGGGRA